MGAAEHLDAHLDAGDERLRQALADAANHRIPADHVATVHELVPMHNVEADPVVMYSPTGSVMVAFGELVLRFRTPAAFDLARESIDRQCIPGRADGPLTFDQLQVRSQVRVLGEWHWVDAISKDRTLLLREVDEPCARPFWYEPTEGELFTAAEPF